MNRQDTIAAIATPLGTGAVGIVRLSGDEAIGIADRVFCSASGKRLEDIPGYSGLFGHVWEGQEAVDEAIATVYRSPRSYTGEDCVELSCHGGSFLVQRVLGLCIAEGARPALPGEFTKRSFLNGKLDLSQAEAVCDLINAGSESARRAALAAKDGALSTAIFEIVENLTAESAHLSAWCDYPEEDLAPVDPQSLTTTLRCICGKIEMLLDTYSRGQLIQNGVETAIVGKPNVGKSTLMNLMSGTRRSIVTPTPGTTRDIVRESVRVGDYMLCLMDTAGIHETTDPIEQEGVRLAKDQLESAQLVLVVFDSSLPLDENDSKLLDSLGDVPCIGVVNKVDLPMRLDVEEVRKKVNRVVYLSAESGRGQEELENEIADLLGLNILDPSGGLVATKRQWHLLLEAQEPLLEATAALEGGMTLDAVAVCIEMALDSLLSLTGERATDKVVDQVFARFCVGK